MRVFAGRITIVLTALFLSIYFSGLESGDLAESAYCGNLYAVHCFELLVAFLRLIKSYGQSRL